MSYASVNSVHNDVWLTEFGVSYENATFIGRNCVGTVPVEKLSDMFVTKDKRSIFHYEDNKFSTYGSPGRAMDRTTSNTTYLCANYGEEEAVARQLQMAADGPLDPLFDGMNALMWRIKLAEEVRIATLLQTSGNYAAANYSALSGASRWDTTTGDPIADIATKRDTVFRSGSSKLVGWMGIDVYTALKSNAKIVDRIKYTGQSNAPAKVIINALRELFDLDELYVGEARKETADLGTTASYARVWGKYFGIAAVEPSPTRNCLEFASVFEQTVLKVNSYFEPGPGTDGVDVIKAYQVQDLQVVASDAGALLATVIS